MKNKKSQSLVDVLWLNENVFANMAIQVQKAVEDILKTKIKPEEEDTSATEETTDATETPEKQTVPDDFLEEFDFEPKNIKKKSYF